MPRQKEAKRLALADYRKQKKPRELIAGEFEADDGSIVDFYYREPTGRNLMAFNSVLPGREKGESEADWRERCDVLNSPELLDSMLDMCVSLVCNKDGKPAFADVEEIDHNVDSMNDAIAMFGVIMNHVNVAKKKPIAKR